MPRNKKRVAELLDLYGEIVPLAEEWSERRLTTRNLVLAEADDQSIYEDSRGNKYKIQKKTMRSKSGKVLDFVLASGYLTDSELMIVHKKIVEFTTEVGHPHPVSLLK